MTGKTVDEVEIEAIDAVCPELPYGRLRLIETLYAIDGALNRGIEALDSQAGSIEPALPEDVSQLRTECARVDFNRDLGIVRDREPFAEFVHDRLHLDAGHDRRRSASEMNLIDDEKTTSVARDQLNLMTEGIEIANDRRLARGNRGVASAIPAHRAAERDVEV